MGSSLMLKTAGEMGSQFPLRAIAAVNCPFDNWLTVNLMRGSPYEKNLVRDLVKELITRDKIKGDEDRT